MGIFLKDRNSRYSWNDLIADLNGINSYDPLCYSAEIYPTFLHIVLSLILGEEIFLSRADILPGEGDLPRPLKKIGNSLNISSEEELLTRLRQPKPNWRITLFTSGTTGQPEKVTHDFISFTRSLKTTDQQGVRWGFCYHPAHMAGLQVFFQALLNGNGIINLSGFNREEILSEIEVSRITHISATPTFYRMLFPVSRTFPLVRRITTGGEKLSESLRDQLIKAFPNAKFNNIYALTETGPLFASHGSEFMISDSMRNLIKIEEHELVVHRDLLGLGEKRNDGKDWYRTGDLVDITSESPLKFIFTGRRTEMINVGGYKVNPHEVEDMLRLHPGIKDLRVYGKSNSVTGQIVCCEIIRSYETLDEPSVRSFLQGRLQEYKIPRIIFFVNELNISSTGKTKR